MKARVLTVVLDPSARARVRDLFHAQDPVQLFDAGSVTDAVLHLLTVPVELVLIDAGLPPREFNNLLRHVRRSAPNATVLVFCDDSDASPQPMRMLLASRREHCHPWDELDSVVTLHLQMLPASRNSGVDS